MTKRISTLSKTKGILQENHLETKKTLGQNFLVDSNVIDNIINAANINEATVVLEIGAGLGALTEELTKKAKHVLSIEVDYELIPILNRQFSNCLNIDIIHDDILMMDLSELLSPYQEDTIKVIANLPYYITSDILKHLSTSSVVIDEIIVMMQAEVGNRLLSQAGDSSYRAMTVMMQNQYDIEKIIDVSRHVFYPKPNVDSSVLSFKPKSNERYEDFNDFVKHCFMLRRKTIRNNLKTFMDDELIEKLLNYVNVDPKSRPQDISVETYRKMFNFYDEEKSLC